MNSFDTTLSSLWNGSKYPVLYTANLRNADANCGPQLVGPDYFTGVQIELETLKAVGVQAIEVEVGFPMLYRPFFSSQSQYQQYVNFYAKVASAIRALGLKLVVENEFLLNNDVQAGWNLTSFYSSLSWAQYQKARAQSAVVVAQTMHPDYLVVVEEPDTEAVMTGQTQANTVSGSTGMLSQILSSLQQSGVVGTKVGAGVGTWHSQYLQFTHSFVALPVDFIDMHIFPINHDFLPNALTMASTAAAAGKPVTMAQCWTNKVRDSELGVLTYDQIRARNPFDFWQPLDAYFDRTMQKLANYTKMSFMVPFNTTMFYDYLPYDSSTQNLSPAAILDENTQESGVNMKAAIYTSIATGYHGMIVSPADTSPPSTPTNVSGVSGSPNSASITWNASKDNVGVAGYYVYRNGVKIASTASAYYQDSGLTGSTTYTYVVEAFDLRGNVSVPSVSVPVTTRDTVPPSVPTGLAGTAVSCQQIKLTWSPSTDNQGLAGYYVFRGRSASNLKQVGGNSVPSFINYPLTPATTYYFAVKGMDTSGNVSQMSNVITVATPALPSAPTKLAATPVCSKQIKLTWTASTSGLPLLGYYILRGSSASNLTKVAGTGTSTSYTDYNLTPSTKYYYALQAIDKQGDMSPMSVIVAATTQ